MASKNISITEDVYNQLLKIKAENESFSDLLTRLLKSQKKSIEKFFGAWDLDDSEKIEMWEGITSRPGRRWKKKTFGESE